MSAYLEDEFLKREKYFKNRPHIVFLGVGASIAAIPNGDKHGKVLYEMNGIMGQEWKRILDIVGIDMQSANFEEVYAELSKRDDCEKQRILLEALVEKYLGELVLPDNPTVYDYLLLSLTNKDLVATFNWDPLLVEAYARCREITKNLPKLEFLHGNIAVGACEEHMITGSSFGLCSICGRLLRKVPLLYPVQEKKYNERPYISMAWNHTENYLSQAYRMTIFGYSAPKRDTAAIDMLNKVWRVMETRDSEAVEIIDIKPEKEIRDSWASFNKKGDYIVHQSFFDSALCRYPRRTCEVLYDSKIKSKLTYENKGFTSNMGFEEITDFLHKLLDDESEAETSLNNPYVH